MNSVEPDLKLGGFSLWVFGRQFPNATDYWDGNWLNVRARIEAPGAVVQAQGSFVFAPDLASFTQQLETLYAALAGEARLRSLEPNLEITIQCGTGGHVAAKFMITPDHMTQSHEFEFYLDQTYLGPLLDGCRNVLSRWPVRPQTSASGLGRVKTLLHNAERRGRTQAAAP